MKRIFLMRHGKAEDGYSKTDFERELLPKGIKKSKKVALFLKEKGVNPNTILVSMAQRTLDTANVIKEILHISNSNIREEKSLYLASTNSILDAIYSNSDSIESIMIIGHNPGISSLATYLSNRNIDWMPTSSVVGIEFELQKWNEIASAPAKLLFYVKANDL